MVTDSRRQNCREQSTLRAPRLWPGRGCPNHGSEHTELIPLFPFDERAWKEWLSSNNSKAELDQTERGRQADWLVWWGNRPGASREGFACSPAVSAGVHVGEKIQGVGCCVYLAFQFFHHPTSALHTQDCFFDISLLSSVLETFLKNLILNYIVCGIIIMT